MNKKLLEMLNEINDTKERITNLVNENNLEEAQKEKEKLKNLQEKFDLLKDILDPEGDGTVGDMGQRNVGVSDRTAEKEFADAARMGFRNLMSEGTPENGGYTVPEDIQTRINEYRQEKASLINFVDVENVTTDKGSRTYKKRVQQTGFEKVQEGGKIKGKTTPQFERISYEIGKYAGYLPVTNELLADTDANITGTIVAWIGDESRVTRNNIIIDVVKKKEKKTIVGLDDIKKILNVELGQAFKPTSRIITNDDGLQWLDTLKN